MGYPLATPAPHVQPHEGQIFRNAEHFSLRASSKVHMRPHSTWTFRAEDFEPDERATLSSFKKSFEGDLAATLKLPDEAPDDSSLLPARKPHPQTFKEALAFSRPKHWPGWLDDQGGMDLEEFLGSNSMTKSPSAPLIAGAGSEHNRRKLHRSRNFRLDDDDPESLLSPFAIQARRYGADVVITGQRLRPSTSTLFRHRIVQQAVSPDAPGTSDCHSGGEAEVEIGSSAPSKVILALPSAQAKATSCGAPYSRGGRRQPVPQSREPFRGPGFFGRPLKGRPPAQCGVGAGGNRRCQRQKHAPLPPPHQQPQHQQPHGLPAANWRARGEGVLQNEEGEKFGCAQKVPKPRLAAGPTGLWDSNCKLNVVRDLLDGYAADPLGGIPPNSSSSFLEKYVERQAEIERLLQDKCQPVAAASAGDAVSEAGR